MNLPVKLFGFFFICIFSWSVGADLTSLDLSKAEVKVTISSDQIDEALKIFNFDPTRVEELRVYFYDTPNLDLFRNGVILRGRKSKTEKNGDDVTVKIRPAQPEIVGESWFQLDGFKCESDFMTEDPKPSCSLTEKVADDQIDFSFIKFIEIATLFNKDQKKYLESYAGYKVNWEDLIPYGPIRSFRWDFDKTDIQIEYWVLPGFKRFLELSKKTKLNKISQTREELEQILIQNKLMKDTSQQSKTEYALELFKVKPL